MDLGSGFDLTESQINRLYLLDWIYDNGGSTANNFVYVGPHLEERGDEAAQSAAADLRAFEENGWIRLQETLGWGGWSCTVTPAGIDVIEGLRQRRGDLVGRRKAARDAFLRWLYDFTVAGRKCPVISEFSSSMHGYYYGIPFSAEEINAASTWLKNSGLLDGETSWNGGGIARPTITPAGEKRVESGRSVNDDNFANSTADAPTFMITNSQNVVIASNSHGAVQTAVLSADNRRQVLAVADAMEQMLDALGLDHSARVDAEQVVKDLREEGQKASPDAGRLRGLLDRLRKLAEGGTKLAAGTILVAYVDQVLPLLPLLPGHSP